MQRLPSHVEGSAEPAVSGPRLVEVAVAAPLAGGLTYALPAALGEVSPGCRVRVPLGSRRVTGMVLGDAAPAPADVVVREVLEALDLEPVLPPELLALARFAADYYAAPLGETLRAFLPAELPPWGERRVSLTDAGALARSRGPEERAVVDALLEHGRLRLADLQRRVGVPRLGRLVEELRRQGRLAVEDPGRRGDRYENAVELKPGELAAQLAACGRSAAGKAAVELLAALGRPATVAELASRVGCGPAVIRRLVALGIVRQFSQPVSLGLGRHRLSAATGPAEIVLRDDQRSAVDAVVAAIGRGVYAGFLLRGMTGSGKTEVFLRAAGEALAAGRSVLLLVPEIALVPSLAQAAAARFGDELAILHSNLSRGERHQEWERIRRGEARIVLGPRSALFAPVGRLGLVVVDEEHDAAYKQDRTPRYHGRDLALLRAQEAAAVALLVSATPSLESRHNAARGKLRELELTRRAGGAGLPEGLLVDLRQVAEPRQPGGVLFSPLLASEIEATLDAGDQVILLRNRRGYSPRLLCRACGESFRCADCGLCRTFHRRGRRLVCHYCGDESPAPQTCPSCGEAALEPIGDGTERVEERFRELFPGVAVDVLDADAARRPGGAAAVLEGFARGTTRVLVGTQMVAKGHHFPSVTLAAVLAADGYLGFPDFRAVERTYALLTQLAGRAGRGERPGRVVVQTYRPDHYAIRAALEHDDVAFAAEELRFRRTFHYPPFTRMVQLTVEHGDARKAAAKIADLARAVHRHPLAAGVRITGPAPAALERLRGRWRHQLLLRAESGGRVRRLVAAVLGAPGGADVLVDVDPQDLA